jgi:hypothetical protein
MAWTEAEQLKKWWGPQSVTCDGAEVDLRVGGRYRILRALALSLAVTHLNQKWNLAPNCICRAP